MVTFIVYAVGLRILWEMAKWNVKTVGKIENTFYLALFASLSFLGWIALLVFILRQEAP